MIARRSLFKFANAVPLLAAAPRLVQAADESAAGKADDTLRIAGTRSE